MTSARSMATPAIDALREFVVKDRLGPGRLIRLRNAGISVVAENAFIGKEPPCRRVPRIEARAHPPSSTVFRIPAKRQFDQRAARRPVEIRTGVIARAQYVVDRQFFHIGLFPIETNLPAALVVF